MIDALHWLAQYPEAELTQLRPVLSAMYFTMSLVWLALIDLARRKYQGPTFL